MKRKWIFMRIAKVVLFVGIGIFLFGYITMSNGNLLAGNRLADTW